MSGINGIWSIDGEGNILTKGLVASEITTDSGEVPVYATGSQKAEIALSGTGQLVNGSAVIVFDDISQHIISGGTPIKVTVTLTADAQGVYVTDKTIHGFTVHELNGGTSNATFDWMAVARRKGYDDAVESAAEPVQPPVAEPAPTPAPTPEPAPTPDTVLAPTAPEPSTGSISTDAPVDNSTVTQ
jgi:hypothetical protein